MAFTASRPRLHFERQGSGPPVVLGHALGCSLHMWDAVVEAIAERHTVVRYDARCHGRSDVVTTAMSLEDLVNDAVRLVDELGHESVTWVGLSLGGMIGQGLAIAHPERVDKLVLANTTSRYPEEGRRMWAERARTARLDGMAALADLLMTRCFSPEFRAAKPAEVARFRRELLAMNADGYAAACDAIRGLDYYSQLHRISCGALVIAGGADVAATPAMAEEISMRIPQSRLAVIEGAGHLSAVERPDVFSALVREFLY